MAMNIGAVTNTDTFNVVTETPLKRSRMESGTSSSMFQQSSSEISSETKKLIVSNCRSIVSIETTCSKLEEKRVALELHRSNGTFPKDLMLPKKKSLFEDEQSKVDDILHSAMTCLLVQRIAETSRKLKEHLIRKSVTEKELLTSLQEFRDRQMQFLADDDLEQISIVNRRFSSNVSFYYNSLAVFRENAFVKAKRTAEKEAKKKKQEESEMDVAPEARVVDVLDQRLKQLGLLNRDSRSRSRSKGSSHTSSRSSSRNTSRSSRSSTRNSSHSSRSSNNSRSNSRSTSSGPAKRSKSSLKSNKKGRKKLVTFSKNEIPTIPLPMKGKVRRRGGGGGRR